MIPKNFLIAWRNLLKNKLVSSINILGLTLGLASSLLAILFAVHELSFEDSHIKANRIGVIHLMGSLGEEMGGEQKSLNSYGPVGADLREMFPEVESASVTRKIAAVVKIGEHLFNEEHILVADSSFFSMFTIPFVSGFPTTQPENIVISKQSANKYFGYQLPIGQVLSMTLFGEKIDFVVTGVFEDLPSNTHLRANFIIPFSLADRFSWRHKTYESTDYQGYVMARPGTDMEDLNHKILSSYKLPIDFGDHGELKILIVPLKDMHFSGSFDFNKGKLLVFLIGGIFVLITSCFNYINLTNIIFSTRDREIGIRMTNGSKRKDIFALFFSDSMLSTFIAFATALILLSFLLPWFNNLMDTHITLLSGGNLILAGIGLYVFTMSLCGLYPAIKYSGSKPITLIKKDTHSNREKSFSRTFLTAFQFMLAVLFIQILLVMHKQTAHLDKEDVIRYTSKNVICLQGHQWGNLKKVKAELLRNPNVEKVSWGSTIPSTGMNLTPIWKDEQNKSMAAKYYFEDDYFDVYQIKMKEGRFFSEEFSSDRENGIVINQKAADELGFPDPVGQMLFVEGKHYKILGIVENYLAQPPIFDHMPMLIWQSRNTSNNLVMRINPKNRKETHEYITQTMANFNSEYPINIRYHDEVLFDMDEAKSFISANQLMNLFFSLTILTSLIGLFGLSVFIAERSRKEVGIRKICGASVPEIIIKLSKGLVFRMSIAAAIATPLGVVVSQGYLSVFPINFNPGIPFFLAGAGIAIFILVTTVIWQTWRAATKNPVEALRYE